ncbi:hypothetical protein C8T65DRAFT_580310 [Cerioporus squamosus]|nr:hypothetical protein C8T65DRAFT_580310 [Cerioporus squamosus]
MSHPQSSSLLDKNTVYKVIVRGEEFQLTHDQISFDSPNYFTTCFTSGFAESCGRKLRLHRNPALFTLIVEYLSGYPILPLSADYLPAGMGVTTAHRFLRADAQFYGLEKLCGMLSLPVPSTYLAWIGLASDVVHLQDVLSPASTLPDGVVRADDGSVVSERTRLPVPA